MLENLKKLNPNLEIYSVLDAEFAPYGEIIRGIDMSELIEKSLNIEEPQSGAAYLASISELENTPEMPKIRDEIYGGMEIQIGLCWGYNTALDALEYHKCTEINVAATDMVLFLGKSTDIKDGKIDSADIKAFFVPAGTAVELNNTTLHYCPCQTTEGGFYSIVVLLRGTNGERTFETSDTRLIGQNKWVLWHADAVPAGGYIGISGENLKLKFK